MQCIRDRVDIPLFGHQHFELDYSAEGQRYGIPLTLDGSSSTATQMDTDRMRYILTNQRITLSELTYKNSPDTLSGAGLFLPFD
jgi:hypothetical protein